MVVLVSLVQANPTSVQWGWDPDYQQAIPSSLLPNSAGSLWETLLSGVERCHLGGQISDPDCEVMGLPLGAESHVNIYLHWDCLQWWQALFSCEGDAAKHHHTASTKRCYSISAAQQSPRHRHTLTLLFCHWQNQNSSLSITFLHMFRLQCTCCRNQRKQAWWWRADMVGLLAALRDRRLAVCSLFQIVWAVSRQPYHPAKLGCKSVEDCLRFLNADKMLCGTWPSVWRWS